MGWLLWGSLLNTAMWKLWIYSYSMVKAVQHNATLHVISCSNLVAISLCSTRWGCECPGQQWRHNSVWCSRVWKPGLYQAASPAWGQPKCGQQRLPAAHPQSSIWGTYTVSPPACREALWQRKRAPNQPTKCYGTLLPKAWEHLCFKR